MSRPQALDIESIEWFDYEIRSFAMRLVEGGDRDDIEQRLTEVMDHPRLREIVQFLALFGFGGVWQHYNGCSPRIHQYLGRERRLADDLSELPTFTPEKKEPDIATAGWLTRLCRRVKRHVRQGD
jgi:hypothetical protein